MDRNQGIRPRAARKWGNPLASQKEPFWQAEKHHDNRNLGRSCVFDQRHRQTSKKICLQWLPGPLYTSHPPSKTRQNMQPRRNGNKMPRRKNKEAFDEIRRSIQQFHKNITTMPRMARKRRKTSGLPHTPCFMWSRRRALSFRKSGRWLWAKNADSVRVPWLFLSRVPALCKKETRCAYENRQDGEPARQNTEPAVPRDHRQNGGIAPGGVHRGWKMGMRVPLRGHPPTSEKEQAVPVFYLLRLRGSARQKPGGAANTAVGVRIGPRAHLGEHWRYERARADVHHRRRPQTAGGAVYGRDRPPGPSDKRCCLGGLHAAPRDWSV